MNTEKGKKSSFKRNFVALLSIGMTNKNNMLPIMQTDGNGFLHSFLIGSIALTGFGVLGYLLFYGSLIKKPEKPVRKAMMGVGLLYFIHLIFYLACIVVFGVQVTSNLMFPVIDLARAVEIPGGFFTRFESLFFVIWIMTIFITSIISFDMAIMGFQSIFKNTSRMGMIFALSPIIFFLAGIPESLPETGEFGRVVSYYGFGLTIIATVLFFFILKIKGVKKNG
ncbi:GerAB/ArcD/ProY family transporter [Salirhabdus sp. Marseille-P4669]|uniref:GerAB/ArcD/ProY family transporter n=1 Tax=Salirhabdus sp. Marseille-P4669 TaxID=2042310 RepID=UPI000C79EB5A|nr:GerAB/ArcD/ProY family transporter [Salirhabdus sp. Marseille-P4669]